MRLFLTGIILLSISACTHHHKKTPHHHHKVTDTYPAQDHGNGEYVVQHRGETYYFNSEAEMLTMEDKIKLETKGSSCVRRAKILSCKDP